MTLNTANVPTVDTSSRNKYLRIIDDAWLQHIAPRDDNAPTVISTFAGCGGSSLGYSMAGFKELLAVEWNDNAVETFRLNFPDVPVYHGDINALSVEQVLEMTGLKAGELDVFDGSPPCQGFSVAGKRESGDPRNQLFREYVRLLKGLQPKVFVMENVSGMVKGNMKLIFVEILRELKAAGYQVKACLLNAMYFNVPQSRNRMIFIGVRNDLGIAPSHPKAEVAPFTVGEAIHGLLDDLKERIIIPDKTKTSQEMKLVKAGERHNVHFSQHRLSMQKVAPVIVASRDDYNVFHPTEHRPITTLELRRISSFPDTFKYSGSVRDFFERVGNSVPPLFMRSIAIHIRREILSEVNLT